MSKAGGNRTTRLPHARSAPLVNSVDYQRRITKLLKKSRRERIHSYSLSTEIRHLKQKNLELAKSNQDLKLGNARLVKEKQELRASEYNMCLKINELQEEKRMLSETVAKIDRDLGEGISYLVKMSQCLSSAKGTVNKARKSQNRSHSKEYFRRSAPCNMQNSGAEQSCFNSKLAAIPRAENLLTGTVNPMVQGIPLLKPKLHIQRLVFPQPQTAPHHRQNMISPITEEDLVEGDVEEATQTNRDCYEPRSRTGMQYEFLPAGLSGSLRIQNRAENRPEHAMPESLPLHLEPVVRLSDVGRLLRNSTVANISQQTKRSQGSNEEQIARAESFTGTQRYFADESRVAQREHLGRTPEEGCFRYGEPSRCFSFDLHQSESRNETSVRHDCDPMEGSSWMHQGNNSSVPKKRMRMSNLGRRANRTLVTPSLSKYSESHLDTSSTNKTQDLSATNYLNTNDVDLAQSEVTSSKACNETTSPDSPVNSNLNVALPNDSSDDHGARSQSSAITVTNNTSGIMQHTNPFVKMDFLEREEATFFKEVSDVNAAEESDFQMAEDDSKKEAQSSPLFCIPNNNITIRRDYARSAQAFHKYRETKSSLSESTSLSESESPLIPEIKIIVEKLPPTQLPVETISSELSETVKEIPEQPEARITTRRGVRTRSAIVAEIPMTHNTRSHSAAPNKRKCIGKASSAVDTTTQLTHLKRGKQIVTDKMKRASELFIPRAAVVKKRSGQKQLNRKGIGEATSSAVDTTTQFAHLKRGKKNVRDETKRTSELFSGHAFSKKRKQQKQLNRRSSSNSTHSTKEKKSIEVEQPCLRFVVGYHAVCDGCGHNSVDLNQCRHCNKKLPMDVATVPVGDALLNIVCDDTVRCAPLCETSCDDNQQRNHSQAPSTSGATEKKSRARRKVAPKKLAEPLLNRKLRR